jgi:hypothetical protein
MMDLVTLDSVLDFVSGHILTSSTSFNFFYSKSRGGLYRDLTRPEHVPMIDLYHHGGANSSFEILTKEYIDSLANYLQQRYKFVGKEGLPILEVGAGDGRLAHLLNASGIIDVQVIATDLEASKGDFKVVKMHRTKALGHFRPAIVLCSWMPWDEDWSREWRSPSSNLREYVLIGEQANCGKSFETYGLQGDACRQDPKVEQSQGSRIAPYFADGWEKVYLEKLSSLQLTGFPGYRDSSSGSEMILTRTISFRKLRVCAICKISTMSVCSVCKCSFFCSAECQKRGWSVHRGACKKGILI